MVHSLRSLLLAGLAAAVLSGCALISGPEPRFAADAVTPSERVSTRYRGIEVVTVTLPSYAAAESIYVREADGALTELGPLWADDPDRAVTQQLAGDLATITGSTVAAEPWPFRDFPDARVDVRLVDLYATTDGRFRLAGQYFVAPENGVGDRSGRFGIELPLAGPPTAATVAAARGQAISQLALRIARNGLR